MNKKKTIKTKLTLESLSVESFVAALDEDVTETIQGGYTIPTWDLGCNTTYTKGSDCGFTYCCSAMYCHTRIGVTCGSSCNPTE